VYYTYIYIYIYGTIYIYICIYVYGHDTYTIHTIENGVGNIGSLSTSRARVIDHRFKHLCGSHNGLARNVALGDNHLLRQRHLFTGNFHPHVATCHHDTIGHSKDFVEVFET